MPPAVSSLDRADLRKVRRKQLHYPAWIDLGEASSRQFCAITDISTTGAKLTVSKSGELPDEFTLLLALPAKAQRRCRVTWRSDVQIGVRFLSERELSIR